MAEEDRTTEDPEGVLWHVSGVMIGGPGLWGLVGWLLGLWTDWTWLLPAGIVLGFLGSMYIVWVRYFSPDPVGPPAGPATRDLRRSRREPQQR
jgi:hypothetical protein